MKWNNENAQRHRFDAADLITKPSKKAAVAARGGRTRLCCHPHADKAPRCLFRRTCGQFGHQWESPISYPSNSHPQRRPATIHWPCLRVSEDEFSWGMVSILAGQPKHKTDGRKRASQVRRHMDFAQKMLHFSNSGEEPSKRKMNKRIDTVLMKLNLALNRFRKDAGRSSETVVLSLVAAPPRSAPEGDRPVS